jgi:hypothetical protein
MGKNRTSVRLAGHSTLAPDAFTRAAHIGASAAMKSEKSRGDPILACALNLAKFALISGDRRPSLMAALSLLTIDPGAPAGASTPVHEAGGNPLYPLSIMVGTSGSAGSRCGLMTAKAFTLPDAICGNSVVALDGHVELPSQQIRRCLGSAFVRHSGAPVL